MQVVGVHFWREKWERDVVAGVYEEFGLGEEGGGKEPRFGRERKVDRFEGVGGKYSL